MVGLVLRLGAIAVGRDIQTLVLEPRRKNFHVVAAAAWQDFHHGAIRTDTKKRQGFRRMPVRVTRHIARRAVACAEQGFECVGGDGLGFHLHGENNHQEGQAASETHVAEHVQDSKKCGCVG